MINAKSIFSFKSVALRPRLACEITPAAVVRGAARHGRSGDLFSLRAFASRQFHARTQGSALP